MTGKYTDTTYMQDGAGVIVKARGTGGVGEEIDKLDTQLESQNMGAADIDATRMKAATALVIASGVITVTQGVHTVTSETGTSDDLTTINITGSGARWFVLLKATAGHTITLKHATANIKLSTSADYVLSGDKAILLWHDGTNAVDLGQPGTGTTDEKAKVSDNDTTAGYLNGKLVAGSGIQLTENNDGGNETLTITNTGAAGAALPVNALPNSSFENWERGTALPPDGWIVAGAGASVARDTNVKHGVYSAKLTRAGTDCSLSASVYIPYGSTYVRGREYTFKAWVYATVASRVRIYIQDDAASTLSSYHTGGSAWEELTVTRTINGATNTLRVGLYIDGGDTSGYIDGARLVEGASAPAYEPHVLPFNRFPLRATLWHDEATILAGAALATTVQAAPTQNYAQFTFQNPGAQNDEFTHSVWLEAGTYTFSVMGVTNSSYGKVDWYIDEVSAVSAQDWYSVSPTWKVIKTATVTVVGSGYHVLRGKVASKHASSSGYYLALNKYWFKPSAD